MCYGRVGVAVNMGVDGACSDALGCTPLHKAVAIGDANIDTVRLLLNATKGELACPANFIARIQHNAVVLHRLGSQTSERR